MAVCCKHQTDSGQYGNSMRTKRNQELHGVTSQRGWGCLRWQCHRLFRSSCSRASWRTNFLAQICGPNSNWGGGFGVKSHSQGPGTRVPHSQLPGESWGLLHGDAVPPAPQAYRQATERMYFLQLLQYGIKDNGWMAKEVIQMFLVLFAFFSWCLPCKGWKPVEFFFFFFFLVHWRVLMFYGEEMDWSFWSAWFAITAQRMKSVPH